MALLAFNAALECQRHSLATSTHKQYDFHVRQVAQFCAVTGAGPFSRPPECLICAYVAYLARSDLKHSTVQQYLKGLRDFYVHRGYSVFASRVHWRCCIAP
jgi:site-specific recombinase XerD